jgi:hypothetical protein
VTNSLHQDLAAVLPSAAVSQLATLPLVEQLHASWPGGVHLERMQADLTADILSSLVDRLLAAAWNDTVAAEARLQARGLMARCVSLREQVLRAV